MNRENTKKWIARFKAYKLELETNPQVGIHPLLQQAQIDAAQSEIDDLEEQLKLGDGEDIGPLGFAQITELKLLDYFKNTNEEK